MSGMIASAILLMVGISMSIPAFVVTCFALAMGALGASESSFWTTGVALGRRQGGLSGAFLNAGGNAGGIPAPYLTPLIAAAFGWQSGLAVAGLLCIAGSLLWLWIDAPEE
jgi:dipeptide/tripeptide permease